MSHVQFKQWLLRNRRMFVIWSIAGVVGNILAMLYFKPWGPALGVANSPQRQIYRVIFDWWVMKLPLALLAFSLVAEKDKWLARRGTYIEGQEYPVLDTYNWTAAAFMAALFAASGVLSYEFFALPAAPAAISVSFFHPVIGFFTLWLGGVVRSLVWGTGNPVLWALGIGPSDGSTWIYLGIFYWWFREETKWGKNPLALMIYWVVIYTVWRTIYMFDGNVWLYPVPALWARMVWFFTQFIPSGLLGTLAGLIAVEGIIRAVESRSRRQIAG